MTIHEFNTMHSMQLDLKVQYKLLVFNARTIKKPKTLNKISILISNYSQNNLGKKPKKKNYIYENKET